MHIKLILPRFHTNMFYPTKILLENKYKISIDCSFKGFNENYSYLKPKIISESFISKFIKKQRNAKNILQGDPVNFHQFYKRVDQGTGQYS